MAALAPQDDVKALTDKIQYIRLHPEDASRKGKNGRNLFKKGYSWNASMDKITTLLDQIIVRKQ